MPVQTPAYGARSATAGQALPIGRHAETVRVTRRRSRVGRIFSSLLLGSVVCLVLVGTAGMALGLWRFTVIDTGSMRPTLNPGDVAVLEPERLAELRKGQIVAFHPPGQPGLTVMHRVFSIHHTRHGVVMRTKGDANNAPDAWHARIVTNTVWRESLKAPTVGYLAVWAQQRPVRLAVLFVTIVVIVSMGMGSIWRPRSD